MKYMLIILVLILGSCATEYRAKQYRPDYETLYYHRMEMYTRYRDGR